MFGFSQCYRVCRTRRVSNASDLLEFLTKLFEVVPTDEYTSDVEEGLMDFGSAAPSALVTAETDATTPTSVPPPTDRRPSRCRGLVPAAPPPRRCPAFARRADALANHRPGRLAPDRGDDAVGRLDRPPQGCDPPTATTASHHADAPPSRWRPTGPPVHR